MVEEARLESVYTLTGIVGSNPILSVSVYKKAPVNGAFLFSHLFKSFQRTCPGPGVIYYWRRISFTKLDPGFF